MFRFVCCFHFVSISMLSFLFISALYIVSLSRWHAKTSIWQILMGRCIHALAHDRCSSYRKVSKKRSKIKSSRTFVSDTLNYDCCLEISQLNVQHRRNICISILSMVRCVAASMNYIAEGFSMSNLFARTRQQIDFYVTMSFDYQTRCVCMYRPAELHGAHIHLIHTDAEWFNARIWFVLKICSKCWKTQKCHVLTRLWAAFFSFFFFCVFITIIIDTYLSRQ